MIFQVSDCPCPRTARESVGIISECTTKVAAAAAAETGPTQEQEQGCQMAKFDPFLSLDCAGVEGVGAQSKERKGSNFAA